MLDFLCVSDLSTWVGSKITYIGPPSWKNWDQLKAHYGPDPCVVASHIEHSATYQNQTEWFTPIGTLLTSLFEKLAWQFPEMRRLSRYLRVTKIGGAGAGSMRKWPLDIYSEKTRKELESGALSGLDV